MTTWLDFTRVSQATRLAGSCARQASRTLSEMRSATLSGWPSPTDSEEKTNDLDMVYIPEGRRRTDQSWTLRKPNINIYRFCDATFFQRFRREPNKGVAALILEVYNRPLSSDDAPPLS